MKIYSLLQDLPINMIPNAFIFKRITFEPKDINNCYSMFVEKCINNVIIIKHVLTIKLVKVMYYIPRGFLTILFLLLICIPFAAYVQRRLQFLLVGMLFSCAFIIKLRISKLFHGIHLIK